MQIIDFASDGFGLVQTAWKTNAKKNKAKEMNQIIYNFEIVPRSVKVNEGQTRSFKVK